MVKIVFSFRGGLKMVGWIHHGFELSEIVFGEIHKELWGNFIAKRVNWKKNCENFSSFLCGEF